MRVAFIILVVVTLSLGSELPHFSLLDCHEAGLDEYDFCVSVEFPYDGEGRQMVEIAAVKKLDGYDDMLAGVLVNVPNSRVSVTIEGNVTEVMVSTEFELFNVQITGDLNDGVYEEDSLPNDGTIHWPEAPLVPEEEDMRGLESFPGESRANFNEAGYEIKVHFLYDDLFKNQFGNNSVHKIEKILTHAETFFSHASLGFVLKPVLVKIGPMAGQQLTATSTNLQSFGTYVKENHKPYDANAYVGLTYENNQGGVVGIAYVGTTCRFNQDYQVSLNEYFRGDIRTAAIVVHEIGHNLAMRHDFGSSTSVPRYSSTGEACSGIGGYMDYTSNPFRWSPCSVEDFRNFVAEKFPVDSFCLKELTGNDSTTAAPTTPSTTSASTTESTTSSTTETPPGGECKDEYPLDCYKNRVKCDWMETNEFWNKVMTQYCPKRCGLCEGKCEDLLSSAICEKRKNKGRCEQPNHGWGWKTIVMCEKTCGICT